MRLRLRFSAAYDLGEHQQIMLPVPPHLRTVRDFACHVSRRLKLTTSGAGTEPPLFFLDEFVLSQTDELRTVVRDDETLDVKLPCAQMAIMPPQVTAPALQALPASGKREASSTASSSSEQPVKRAKASSERTVQVATTRKVQPVVLPKPAASSSSSSSDDGSEKQEPSVASKAVTAVVAVPDGARPQDIGSTTGLYVKGLADWVDGDQLLREFSRFGAVESAKVIIDFDTEKSKGFGFVEFQHVESAAKALSGGPRIVNGDFECDVQPRKPRSSGEKGKTGKGKGKG
eukprot:CAMPEP_0194513676 /NCGR_PEP_ID=MMETSP0253-20130528/46011_1 /TAXON_ID=2966 /ORGANISM="Noctiluca scintillans" /LENGTH=287 /DNA_ID=CAMNT_0039357249 /DNA_START=11 /DNA_END=871 /DNA_ORIENTATION=+